MKDPLPSKPRCYLRQSLLTLQAKACGPWLLGTSLGSGYHSHRVVRCQLFLSVLPGCLSIHPPGPTYRCPFTEPFDGFNSTCGQSSGFTTDSPAPESTVISRYRPRLRFTRFTVDSHVSYCDCVQVHFVRPPVSIIGAVAWSVFSFTGDVILWPFNWKTLVHLQLLAHNGQESSLRGNLSHRAQTSVRFVSKDPFCCRSRNGSSSS